jgi:hypothetical protein
MPPFCQQGLGKFSFFQIPLLSVENGGQSQIVQRIQGWDEAGELKDKAHILITKDGELFVLQRPYVCAINGYFSSRRFGQSAYQTQ